jgi:uncharacterized protein YidB (DUF937 family)
MKKLWIIGTLAALALIVFGVVGFAYAQSQNTGTPNKDTGYGCGMFGTSNRQQVNSGRMGRGMMGYGANNQGNSNCPMADGDEDSGYGVMHDAMVSAFAQALGLTPEELQTRLQAGDTLWVIAQERGMTTEQFQEMMTTARNSAVNQAVADGVITQEQADFMLERMGRMMGNGIGSGLGAGNGGCGGRWNNQP